MIATRQDIRRAAGRVIACGFDGITITAELKDILREVQPAGVVMFARNVEDPQQLAELGRELKQTRTHDPLLLAVDQEGGRVARMRNPATEWPPMRRLGEIGDDALARRVGAALARELRAVNIDVDFAPVLDVDTNPDNPVIADRSFSRDPAVVARLGTALALGLQDNGVAACGKHFPGHGDTDKDSHVELPHVEHDLERLRHIEWPPFKTAIDAGLDAVMTAHVIVRELDERHPGTLSPKVLGYLRGELGFAGVIISDDIEMQAVASRYSTAQIAELGLNAGIDLFLACHKPGVVLELYRGVVKAVEQGRVTHDALLGAEQRVVAWRRKYCQRAVDPKRHADAGCAEHRALAEEIAVRLSTLA